MSLRVDRDGQQGQIYVFVVRFVYRIFVFIPIQSCACLGSLVVSTSRWCILALLVGAHTTSSAKHRLKNMLRPAHLRGGATPPMAAGGRGRLPGHVAQPLVAALAGAMGRGRRACLQCYCGLFEHPNTLFSIPLCSVFSHLV